MRKVIFLIFLNVLLVNCNFHKKENTNKIKMGYPIEKIAKDKRFEYGISLNVRFPFELYVNNIIVERSNTGGSMMAFLKPVLLKNGKYIAKIKLYKHSLENDFDIQGWGMQSIQLYKWLNDEKGKAIDDSFEVIETLYLSKILSGLSEYEQEWEIEIKDLPYELESWSNGVNLSKWNKKVLKKEVVKHYENLKTILNKGDAERWMKISEKRRNETNIFNFETKENIQRKFKENSRKIREYAKGNMVSIENYNMKVYGINNQLVSLERIDGENKGEGVLRTLEPDGAIRIYNVKLYLPKDGSDFVIIRK